MDIHNRCVLLQQKLISWMPVAMRLNSILQKAILSTGYSQNTSFDDCTLMILRVFYISEWFVRINEWNSSFIPHWLLCYLLSDIVRRMYVEMKIWTGLNCCVCSLDFIISFVRSVFLFQSNESPFIFAFTFFIAFHTSDAINAQFWHIITYNTLYSILLSLDLEIYWLCMANW